MERDSSSLTRNRKTDAAMEAARRLSGAEGQTGAEVAPETVAIRGMAVERAQREMQTRQAEQESDAQGAGRQRLPHLVIRQGEISYL